MSQKAVLIKDLPRHVGETVTVRGQVRTMRIGKKFSFIELGYGRDQVQVIVPSSLVGDLTIQSYIGVTGIVKSLPEGVYSSLPVELGADSITIISRAKTDYEQQCPPQSSSETKLKKRHFYLRDQKMSLVLTAHSQLLQAMREYFQESGCLEITPPSFGKECEGGATLFKLEHPGESHDKPMTVFLTQSSQFALEVALPAVGDCYCIAPSFRAEHSHTRRHLTEFLHLESEWGGVLSFDDHLQKLKDLMEGIIRHFLKISEPTLKALKVYDRVVKLHEMTKDIMILEHKDAIKECRKRGIYKDEATKTHFDDRDDIPEAQERKLIDQIGKIVFLTKFPFEFKSFYMALDKEDPSLVLGCDVEVPGVGEIVGSGVREADPETLKKRMIATGLKPEDYESYLALREYGFCQTSGMGLGVGRMLCWLLDEHSIRDVTAFPCYPGYIGS